jgi:hypothetical protein
MTFENSSAVHGFQAFSIKSFSKAFNIGRSTVYNEYDWHLASSLAAIAAASA